MWEARKSPLATGSSDNCPTRRYVGGRLSRFRARPLTPAPEQNFPQYAANFVRRFVTGSYASVSSSVALTGNASAPLARDAFGFRKVIVAATAHGKVYGLDSADGAVLWSRVFGLGWAAEVGGQVIPVKIFTTRTVGDGDAPQVVVVTQRKASNVRVSKQAADVVWTDSFAVFEGSGGHGSLPCGRIDR